MLYFGLNFAGSEGLAGVYALVFNQVKRNSLPTPEKPLAPSKCRVWVLSRARDASKPTGLHRNYDQNKKRHGINRNVQPKIEEAVNRDCEYPRQSSQRSGPGIVIG